jgi:opacity protein-like surface antigen
MKKILLVACVVVMAFALVGSASAQGKISLNIGADVLLPMGTFGDAVNIGFGGTAQGEYAVMPQMNITLTSGYLTWSLKNVPAGATGGSVHGIPVLAGVKYYFMPKGTGVQVYGAAQLGFFIASVALPSVVIGGVTYGGGSASETDFAFAPIVGVEIPAGATGAVDISVRYFDVATTGSSSGSVGARVGYKFGI